MNLVSIAAPRRVLLFAGHMVDAPGRSVPRFPAGKVPAAKAAIEQLLLRLDTGEGDIGVGSAACGADLLFAHAALARHVALHIHLPFDAETFVRESVAFAGPEWERLFHSVAGKSVLHLMPAERAEVKPGRNPFELNNEWMIEIAMAAGAPVVLACLWDGATGDGPGGTGHLVDGVRQAGGSVHIVDPLTPVSGAR